MIARHWALLEADFHREYRIGPAELASLSTRAFLVRLRGLSAESLFREVVRKEPVELTDADAIDRALDRL